MKSKEARLQKIKKLRTEALAKKAAEEKKAQEKENTEPKNTEPSAAEAELAAEKAADPVRTIYSWINSIELIEVLEFRRFSDNIEARSL